ncbi:MAG: hypothetical protein A3J67_01275 [Parcubacteria group bacterium RIFCSPHIGHO2_02_FULL_48_10b]|nr:MAG: hypothetical protein A3J67_01275 [Parcubacteria group bacterium RIFCSPHIGHO2_02_FULL_48_10b]
MIVVRAPLRISFVGGGTDLPDFYTRYPGRVVSTAIDKYVYIVINRTPLIDLVSARYSISETVDHPSKLQHTRIRAALLDLGIKKNIEIASFASLPSKTGLGSSSSFSVALMRSLQAYLGTSIDRRGVAEAASRLEIELCGEPIGKQDQYAAAFGGFNTIQFNSDHSVKVEPILLDYKMCADLEERLLIFFSGLTRSASSVLGEQKSNIRKEDKFQTMKEMSDSVPAFVGYLLAGDYAAMGRALHEGWQRKKSLAQKVSNPVIDDLYGAAIRAGAWGGKVLGAGGGGCLMFIVPPEAKGAIRECMRATAQKHALQEFRELPIKFVQSGVEVLYNAETHIV